MITGRQLNVLSDLAFGFGNRALQIAIANAEFDRNVARVVFAIDVRCSGLIGNVGEVSQRHWRSAGRVHRNAADRIDVIAKLRQESHDHIEAPLAVQNLRDGLSSNRCLHGRVDIAGRDSVARGPLTINLDE